MKTFFKENWFKLVIAIALILIGLSLFYYFVIFTSQKEQTRLSELAQKQSLQDQIKQQQAEDAFWNNGKKQTEDSIKGAIDLRTSVENMITKQRNSLNTAYSLKSNPYYYSMLPLINAREHYLATLQSLVGAIDNVNSIRNDILTAIEQRDQTTLDSLATKESDAVDIMTNWINQEKIDANNVNNVQTETIKNQASM